jgi:hypothetical protein
MRFTAAQQLAVGEVACACGRFPILGPLALTPATLAR